MEDLNKNQIVLLTLLVSFVTSIATGIMTNALLQEAPIEITRNINSIVEKTVETIVPATPSIIQSNQKEITTVVVKEEDRIIDSINKNLKSVVRIRERNPFTEEASFYGIGIIIGGGGIATDRKTVLKTNKYSAELSDGEVVEIIPQGIDKQTNFILFLANLPEKSEINLEPSVISEAEVKLGQTLIGLGGTSDNSVTVGRVTSLSTKDSGVGTSTVKVISSINTDITSRDMVSGSPIFNLSGDVVGIKLSNNETRIFTPISVLKNELNSLTETVSEKKTVTQ
ncbi:MAG: trypsin-like peptidase domain-containing protein [Minisyncoccia bacterium]